MDKKKIEKLAEKKENSAGYNAPLIYKAFALLEEVATNQSEQGISDLSRKLNISKSTIFGITQALLDLGVLRQDSVSKKFSLGPTLIKLGHKALTGADLRSIVLPYMDVLSQKYKETVFLGTFDETGITIIEKSDSPAALKITSPVGTRIPMYAGAAGKVFLSSLPEPALQKIFKTKPLPRYTENSITDFGEYRKELQKVRESSVATDFEEYLRGVNAICVPILRDPMDPVGAIWMVGFSYSFTGEKLEQAILETLRVADHVSRELGK